MYLEASLSQVQLRLLFLLISTIEFSFFTTSTLVVTSVLKVMDRHLWIMDKIASRQGFEWNLR